MDANLELFKQGAEARLYVTEFIGKPCLVKERFKKGYRHAELERSISSERTRHEVKALVKCRQCGIRAPALYYVDVSANTIYMEFLGDCVTLKAFIDDALRAGDDGVLQTISARVGELIARLHANHIVHGDLTTSNILVETDGASPQLVLIDFGLTQISQLPEDKGVDLYVLERAFLSTHPNTERVFQSILDHYSRSYDKSKDVIAKLDEVRMRGRKRLMVG